MICLRGLGSGKHGSWVGAPGRPGFVHPIRVNRASQGYLPNSDVAESELLAGGLANTNYRVSADGNSYVIRLYQRDVSACLREKALLDWIRESPGPPIPVANCLFADASCTRIAVPYAVFPFVDGELLLDLEPRLDSVGLLQVANSCGFTVGALSHREFSACGAFGPDLELESLYGEPATFVPRLRP